MKKSLLTCLFLPIFACGLISIPVQAEDNAGDFGLILNGGIGTGISIYGIIPTNTSSTLGTGHGSSVNAGIMANFSLIAIQSQFNYVTINDLEWEQRFEWEPVSKNIKTEGSGHYLTLDGTVGIKALTEEGDMGYTHIFVGFRIWQAMRQEDKRTENGTNVPVLPKEEISGNGFIIGIRDFTTLPLGSVSLALQTGLWLYKAPLSTYKIGGNEVNITADQNIGFGFEIAPGIAFEDSGIAAIVGLRMDIQYTEIKLLSDFVAGTGYMQFFFAVSKEFRF